MTKWIVVGLLCVMAFVTTCKRSTPWVGQDFSSALSSASKEKKPVVAIVGADWCHFCHELQDKTLPDPAVKKALEGWNVVLVDGDSEEGKEVTARYQVGGLPTTLFLDADGSEIHRLVGFIPAEDFVRSIPK